MTRVDMLLVKTSEESDEVGQRAMKWLQFGPTETQAGHARNNLQRLEDEIADFVTVVRMLERETDLRVPWANLTDPRVKAKEAAVERWFAHSAALGRLNTPCDAADLAVQACRELDAMDFCEGYEPHPDDFPKLWAALGHARAALRAINPKGTT